MKMYHPLVFEILDSPKASETETTVTIPIRELDRIIKNWIKEVLCGDN